ncbi:hypothetical protein EST38_g14198, partial [Candolleomyces aberdarensis]
YVTLDLLFKTRKDFIKISVEAYVVKGMTTDFLLGNDFAEQYDLSIERRNGNSRLRFGDIEHYVEANLTDPRLQLFKDEEGNSFKVLVQPDYARNIGRARAHRKAQVKKRRHRQKFKLLEVRSRFDYHIAPETTKLVHIDSSFPSESNSYIIERSAFTNSTPEEMYTIPETLISRDKPFVWVTNFAKLPITINSGQLLGHLSDPRLVYTSTNQVSREESQQLHNYARLIRKLDSGPNTLFSISQQGEPESVISREESNLPINQPLEGGPKTSEIPEDVPKKEDLESEIDVSSNLDENQQKRMKDILRQNLPAFAFDGNLGNYCEEVEIPMKGSVKPISVPPYPLSPANRETVDAQMDAWLKLEVIEPSRSPWAAPVFIVHRNDRKKSCRP